MKRYLKAFVGFAAAALISLSASAQTPPSEITYQGRLFDSTGYPVSGTVLMEFKITDYQSEMPSVTDEPHTLAGVTAVSLGHANVLATSDVVTSLSGATVYVRAVDYTINYLSGSIARVGGGGIPDPSDVLVDYWYSQMVTTLWSETQAVEVTDGLYSVRLGASNPLDASVLESGGAFLEVNVEGQRLTPRQPLTSVPYAMIAGKVIDGSSSGLDADLLDGLDSTAFSLDGHTHSEYALIGHTHTEYALAGHDHDAADIISGTISNDRFSAYTDLTDEGWLDNDGNQYDLMTRVQLDARFAAISHTHDASELISGTLAYGRFSAYEDLSDEGRLDNNSDNDILRRFQSDERYVEITGDIMTGDLVIDGADLQVNGNIGINLAPSSTYGISIGSPFPSYGANFQGTQTGVRGEGNGTGSTTVYGVYGYGYNADTGAVYGGYFQSATSGGGAHYGIRAYGDDWAAWLEGGPVHVGNSGSVNYATSDGDLYVEDDLEVDGDIVAPGAIDVDDVNFYFAGSNSKGGSAIGLECSNCVDSSEVQFNYAGSSSEGGAAQDLSCTDCVSASEVSFNYAGSGSQGGAANDLSCTTCVNSNEVDFTYAYSASKGGAATDLMCTDCLGATQIDDIYVFNTSDSMSGSLTVGGDLTVTGANIGIGMSPSSSCAIVNEDNPATSYGAYMYGTSYGVRGSWASDYSDHYAYLGSQSYGVYSYCGNNDESSTRYGGSFYGVSTSSAYGVYATGYGYGSGAAYGMRGYGYNLSTGAAYGGYFVSNAGSSGTDYAVYADGEDYGLYVSSGTKSWVNPDPEDPTKAVVYATLEGGENGTYVRGTATLENGKATVVLPDHFRKVTNPEENITVQVTPRSAASLGLAVTSRSNSEIVVEELSSGTGNYEFDYIVHGLRLGYEDYEPIIDNVDYVPFQGNLEAMDPSDMTSQEWYDSKRDGLKKIFKKNGTLDENGKVNEKLFREKAWKNVKVKEQKPEEK